MLGSQQPASQRTLPKIFLTYISWYINDYGYPRTQSDDNARPRTNVHVAVVLLPTTDLKVDLSAADRRCAG